MKEFSFEGPRSTQEVYPTTINDKSVERILPAVDFETPISLEDAEVIEKLSNLEDPEFVRQIRPVLRSLLKKIREVEGNKVSADKWVHHMLPHFQHTGVENPLVVLPGTGCAYEKTTGGCSMCNFGCEGREPTKEDIDDAMNFIIAHNERMWKEHPDYRVGIVNLNVPGTFFDNRELAPELRKYVYTKARKFHEKSAGPTVFICEGRFEQITKSNMEEMRKHLGEEMIVDIGVGIESTDLLIREGAINKGLPDDWEERARMIHRVGKAEITGHIVMGAPFLSPKAVVADCEKSLYELLKIKEKGEPPLIDTVLLMNMNRRPGTLIDYLARNGQYNLPNIFSTVQILSSLNQRLTPEEFKRLRVFGLVGPGNLVEAGTDYLKPCKEGCGCEKVFKLLYKYRGTQDEMRLLSEASSVVGDECELKRDFEKMLAQEETDDRTKIKKRIAKTYLLMAISFFPNLAKGNADEVFENLNQ